MRHRFRPVLRTGFRCLPGRMKMIGCLSPYGGSLSSSIECHKRAHCRRLATERLLPCRLKFILYPALIVLRWRERHTLANLILLTPANADEARQKLLYLMAAMVADPDVSNSIRIADAIRTLKPFERPLSDCLSKRRRPVQ